MKRRIGNKSVLRMKRMLDLMSAPRNVCTARLQIRGATPRRNPKRFA
jgi:hypothetical protein